MSYAQFGNRGQDNYTCPAYVWEASIFLEVWPSKTVSRALCHAAPGGFTTHVPLPSVFPLGPEEEPRSCRPLCPLSRGVASHPFIETTMRYDLP